ncbi:hypothetical protein [Pelagicoccus sp. SDUM812003]|uniref:hypothetical protein n=1 Tax=Pelagicoccus sp. SDUM812003 TaxID=3041267 RepID=UPI00280F3C60|nr:hypothetical protein [Pelagicoccus sp. SDUM812003]MDQ8202783.1 hypothetical protein [Pelagicoccus sp. SDUM812003]
MKDSTDLNSVRETVAKDEAGSETVLKSRKLRKSPAARKAETWRSKARLDQLTEEMSRFVGDSPGAKGHAYSEEYIKTVLDVAKASTDFLNKLELSDPEALNAAIELESEWPVVLSVFDPPKSPIKLESGKEASFPDGLLSRLKRNDIGGKKKDHPLTKFINNLDLSKILSKSDSPDVGGKKWRSISDGLWAEIQALPELPKSKDAKDYARVFTRYVFEVMPNFHESDHPLKKAAENKAKKALADDLKKKSDRLDERERQAEFSDNPEKERFRVANKRTEIESSSTVPGKNHWRRGLEALIYGHIKPKLKP